MRNLTFKFLLFFILVSCQEGSDVLEINHEAVNSELETRTSSPSACGYIEELCKPCRFDIKEPVPSEPTFASQGFVVKDGSNEYEVKMIPMFDRSTEFYVKTGDGDFILTDTKNSYIRSKSLETPVPSVLKNLFRLNSEKVLYGEYTDDQVGADLGVTLTKDERSRIIIDASQFTKIDDDVEALPIDPCKGQFMRLMEIYRNELNKPEVITTSSATWMSIVDPVFTACAEGIDINSECLDSRCVVDGILNTTISDLSKRRVKINYLALLLDLNEEQADALAEAEDELLDELFEISNCGTIDFCPDLSNPNDVLEDILVTLIANNSLNEESLLDELIKNDYIRVIDQNLHCEEKGLSMSEDCPRLDKILDLVVGPDGTNPHCSLLNDLGKSSNEIKYIWDCDNSTIIPNSDGSISYGQTQPKIQDKEINVYFSKEICDLDCINILSVVIHESIHADMESLVLDRLPDPDPFNGVFPTFEDAREKWLEIRKEQFNGITFKHKIMAEYYADQYAYAMWEMSGPVGEPSDYLFWAYDGLGIDPNILLGATAWTKIQNDWKNIKDEVKINCSEK